MKQHMLTVGTRSITSADPDVETIAAERLTLVERGFTDDEIVSLLWLKQWYQTGGSDRVFLLRHWEFLRLLVLNGTMKA